MGQPLVDRLPNWLFFFWLCFYVGAVVSSLFGDDFVFDLNAAAVLGISWLILTLASVVIWFQIAIRAHLLQVILIMLLPILTPMCALRVAWFCQDIRDIAHFHAMKAEYDANIARLPKNGARYAEFNWGGMLFASLRVLGVSTIKKADSSCPLRLRSGCHEADDQRRQSSPSVSAVAIASS